MAMTAEQIYLLNYRFGRVAKDVQLGTLLAGAEAVLAGEIALVEGSILLGGASNVAAALDASTDTQILIGNGTTVTSAAVSGDIAITNAGVTSIGADKVNATHIKMASGTYIGWDDGAAGKENVIMYDNSSDAIAVGDFAGGPAFILVNTPGEIAITHQTWIKGGFGGSELIRSNASNQVEVGNQSTGSVQVHDLVSSGLVTFASAQGGQDTTGTGGTVGQVTATGMTATGVVLVTLAEDPGANLSLCDVVAGTDLFTVYTRNSNTDARAALDAKKVNFLILSYS